MIHMVSSFDLKPGEDFAQVARLYDAFLADLLASDLIVDGGPLGRRVHNTPMDTDTLRTQQVFSVIRFRDRAQLDAAYDSFVGGHPVGRTSHLEVHRRITNAAFLCWQDDEREDPAP